MPAPTQDDSIEHQEGETACETKIKYRDVFHLRNLYRYMHEWLINDGWGSHSDYSWPETMYLTNQRSDGEELLVWWRMKKAGESKSMYTKYMDVDFHVLYLKNVETVVNGQKIKANDGEIEIIVRGRLVRHPGFEKHWLLKTLGNIYWENINEHLREQQLSELYQDSYRFHAALKDFFNLYKVEPYKRPFRSIGGLETR